MTDETAAPTRRSKKAEVIEDAVVVDDTVVDGATGTPVDVETAHATATEPVIATGDPAATSAEPVAPGERVVYVQMPPAPKKLGNRVFGVLIALAASILFTALLAVVTAIVGAVGSGSTSFRFLGQAEFYIPTLFFVIAFVILVLLANRANWWAYILGSVIVALVVYFGSIGLGLLGTGIVTNTPDQAAARFAAELGNPFIIVAALLAREVSMWTGTAISRRGRTLKVRNSEARAAYEREVAEKRAAGEPGSTAAAPAA